MATQNLGEKLTKNSVIAKFLIGFVVNPGWKGGCACMNEII